MDNRALKTLATRLLSRNRHEVLEALKVVSPDKTKGLLEILKDLAYHYNTEIRVAALNCLKHADQSELTEIIRDNIRDPDPDVRQAALVLFHLNE